MQSVLAGVEQMNFGFISRRSTKDPYHHEVIASKFFEPMKFARQINLSVRNAWGVLQMFADLLLEQEEGTYVIMKDPNKTIIRVYHVPEGEFDLDEDEESDD